MADPSETIFTVVSSIWYFVTQVGGLAVIWIIGIFLCYYRRDLPRTPRILIGTSLAIQLLLVVGTAIFLRLLTMTMDANGRTPENLNELFLIINSAASLLRMFAHGLLLYGIVGNFRRSPNWDAVAVE